MTNAIGSLVALLKEKVMRKRIARGSSPFLLEVLKAGMKPRNGINHHFYPFKRWPPSVQNKKQTDKKTKNKKENEEKTNVPKPTKNRKHNPTKQHHPSTHGRNY